MCKDIITVAAVNFHSVAGEKYQNCKKIGSYMKRAKEKGVNLVVFPELALTGYGQNQQLLECAEDIKSECVIYLAQKAEDYGLYCVFGMPLLENGGIYNAAVAVGPEGYIGCYKKIHLSCRDQEWSTCGNEGFWMETPWGNIGVAMGTDTYGFHEVARYYTLNECRLYLNLSALEMDTDCRIGYDKILNQIVNTFDQFIVTSNLTGAYDGRDYLGGSSVMGPGVNERIHVYAGGFHEKEPEMFVTTVDLSISRRNFHTMNPLTGEADVRPYIDQLMIRTLLQEEQGWEN